MFGDFLAIFAVLSYVSFNLHASAAQVTLISVSFMNSICGYRPGRRGLVDRWNVKRTMIASDLIRAALALALVLPEVFGRLRDPFRSARRQPSLCWLSR